MAMQAVLTDGGRMVAVCRKSKPSGGGTATNGCMRKFLAA